MENANTETPIRFLSVSDLQNTMGISRAGAYKLARQKGFPSIFVGNRIVIPYDLYCEWINKAALAGRC